MALSSRGLGRCPLTAVTRVRLPLGLSVVGKGSRKPRDPFFREKRERKQNGNKYMRTYVRMAKGWFKYNWSRIQEYYDEGNGYLRCRARFGFAKDTWIKAINCGRIIVRPRQWTLERILAESKSRYTIKRRLLQAGILRNVCDECGLSEWRGRALSIQVDHVNGIRNDHRLENLRMLCPNCHSQTDTYAARNRKRWGRKREIDGELPKTVQVAVRAAVPQVSPRAFAPTQLSIFDSRWG